MQPSATPAGFVQDAGAFLAAAEFTLNRADGPSLPAYFLFARSIELSLKAFLLETGVSAKVLASRDYGHNLLSLHTEAVKRDLAARIALDRIEIGVLDLLSKEYLETRLGYRISSATYLLPLIDVTEQIARRMIHVLDSGHIENSK